MKGTPTIQFQMVFRTIPKKGQRLAKDINQRSSGVGLESHKTEPSRAAGSGFLGMKEAMKRRSLQIYYAAPLRLRGLLCYAGGIYEPSKG